MHPHYPRTPGYIPIPIIPPFFSSYHPLARGIRYSRRRRDGSWNRVVGGREERRRAGRESVVPSWDFGWRSMEKRLEREGEEVGYFGWV